MTRTKRPRTRLAPALAWIVALGDYEQFPVIQTLGSVFPLVRHGR